MNSVSVQANWNNEEEKRQVAFVLQPAAGGSVCGV